MTGMWKYHGKLAAGSSGETSETKTLLYCVKTLAKSQKAIAACNTVNTHETCHTSNVISELTFYKFVLSENA